MLISKPTQFIACVFLSPTVAADPERPWWAGLEDTPSVIASKLTVDAETMITKADFIQIAENDSKKIVSDSLSRWHRISTSASSIQSLESIWLAIDWTLTGGASLFDQGNDLQRVWEYAIGLVLLHRHSVSISTASQGGGFRIDEDANLIRANPTPEQNGRNTRIGNEIRHDNLVIFYLMQSLSNAHSLGLIDLSLEDLSYVAEQVELSTGRPQDEQLRILLAEINSMTAYLKSNQDDASN